MSRISAAWPVAGDGLRGGSGESAEFPTSVKGVVAMFAPSTLYDWLARRNLQSRRATTASRS